MKNLLLIGLGVFLIFTKQGRSLLMKGLGLLDSTMTKTENKEENKN